MFLEISKSRKYAERTCDLLRKKINSAKTAAKSFIEKKQNAGRKLDMVRNKSRKLHKIIQGMEKDAKSLSKDLSDESVTWKNKIEMKEKEVKKLQQHLKSTNSFVEKSKRELKALQIRKNTCEEKNDEYTENVKAIKLDIDTISEKVLEY